MARTLGVALGVLLLASLGCKTYPSSSEMDQKISNLEGTNEQLQIKCDELAGKNGELARQLQELEARLARDKSAEVLVAEAKGEISERVKEILAKFKGDQDIEVLQDPRGLRFVVREQVLFESGSADLLPEGRAALERIAAALAGSSSKISIEGHTDDVRVAKPETVKRFPRGNIELSVMRSVAVWEYLVKDASMPESRVSVAGYGQFRPRVPNDSPQNRMQNRRVEILVAEN